MALCAGIDRRSTNGESTCNSYSLVNGPAEQGYTMHSTNTVAIRQYDGPSLGRGRVSTVFWGSE